MADEKSKVEVIRRENKLRAKVGGSADGKPGRIDPSAIERANLHVSRMSNAHHTQTKIDISDLQQALNLAYTDAVNRTHHLKRVYKISDAIMTLGKTFGYDLLSEFANSLNHFLIGLTTPTPAQMQVLSLHVDAMHVLVREQIKGDGGPVGQALAQSLILACAKLGARRKS